MVQRSFGCWHGGKSSAHSSCLVFIVRAPCAHRLQDTALGELLGHGQGWTHKTQRLVGAAASPRHHLLLQQQKREDPPVRMHLTPVPHWTLRVSSRDAGKHVSKDAKPGSTSPRSPLACPAPAAKARQRGANLLLLEPLRWKISKQARPG